MTQRRWYEKHPVSREAMEKWHRFPIPLQRALAQHVFTMADEMKITSFWRRRLDSLPKGAVTVLLLFRKRRWYDRDPIIRKAFTALGLITLDELVKISERILMLKIHIDRQEIAVQKMKEDDLEKMVAYVFQLPRNVFF